MKKKTHLPVTASHSSIILLLPQGLCQLQKDQPCLRYLKSGLLFYVAEISTATVQ